MVVLVYIREENIADIELKSIEIHIFKQNELQTGLSSFRILAPIVTVLSKTEIETTGTRCGIMSLLFPFFLDKNPADECIRSLQQGPSSKA